ncbi:MAG: GNAT family N-acetyltransferase [Proteobacteria bacterium]|nr:GNAT family N-acetyltransferase [Pseudomonadota bacterium]
MTELKGADLEDICQATEEAIRDGLGFDWVKPPVRETLEAYWRGVLLVPERELVVGRGDGTIAGTAQFVKPTANNEAGAFNCTLTTFFVAPWARGHGLARDMLTEFEKRAKKEGLTQISLDVRETQQAAIALYESAGYVRWGVKEKYALVDGKFIRGCFYTKDI